MSVNNKKLKYSLIVVVILFALIVGLLGIGYGYNKYKLKNTIIEDDYYAVLQGGSGEVIYKTYLYIDGSEYRYIQVVSTTKSYGSSEWTDEVTEVGYLTYPQDVITKANEFGSSEYAIINVDIMDYSKGDIITIEELNSIISID